MDRAGRAHSVPVTFVGSDRRSAIPTGVCCAIMLLSMLPACSSGEQVGNTVDLSAAAARAEGDIADYAASQEHGRPAPLPAASAVPAIAEAASNRSARDIVRRYYALLSAGRDAEARKLWERAVDQGGQDLSGIPGFARYTAETGTPRNPDAGAGQRYVTVPVHLAGDSLAGKPLDRTVLVVLHRVAEGIETPDPAAHRWRIARITPDAPAAAGPVTATARYRCAGGFSFVARFDNQTDTATLRVQGRRLATLTGQRPASGIWYAGMGFTLRGKGKQADLVRPDGSVLRCSASG